MATLRGIAKRNLGRGTFQEVGEKETAKTEVNQTRRQTRSNVDFLSYAVSFVLRLTLTESTMDRRGPAAAAADADAAAAVVVGSGG